MKWEWRRRSAGTSGQPVTLVNNEKSSRQTTSLPKDAKAMRRTCKKCCVVGILTSRTSSGRGRGTRCLCFLREPQIDSPFFFLWVASYAPSSCFSHVDTHQWPLPFLQYPGNSRITRTQKTSGMFRIPTGHTRYFNRGKRLPSKRYWRERMCYRVKL